MTVSYKPQSETFTKVILYAHRYIFYIALFLSLTVTSLFRIGWPSDETVHYIYHIQNRLMLIVYILLATLTFFSLIIQLFNISSTNLSLLLKNHRIEFLVVCIVLLMCISAYLGNQNRDLFVLVMLACLSWPIRQKKIILEILIFQMLLLATGFILLISNYTSDYVYFEHGIRHTLGFGHPNSIGLIVFSLVILIWLYHTYSNAVSSVFVFCYFCVSSVALVVSYILTKSRTSFLAGLLFTISIIIFYQLMHKRQKPSIPLPLTFSLSVFPFICAFGAILLGILFEKLNFRSNFSFRFYEGIWAISKYGISAFGTDSSGYTLDNNYFAILVRAGFICSICYLLISSLSCFSSIKNKKPYFFIFCIVLSLYQTMESYLTLWPSLFLLFSCSFSDNNLSNLFRKSDMNI